MRSKRGFLFSTHWSSDNIIVKVQGGFMMAFYIKLFFKNWTSIKPKESKNTVIVKFDEELIKHTVKTPLFNYSRSNYNKTIITSIFKLNLLRAILRSFYKFINKKASVVGLSELYMSIIRSAIIEPIEYINHKNGWRLIHASAFKFNNKTFVVSAGSKVGKSTLVSKLMYEFNCDIISDNYCFIKDNKVRSIEEPMRGGKASRNRISFYGRTINGYPNNFEGEIDYFIVMKRGIKNQLTNLNYKELNLSLNQTNNIEKEGVFYLDENDSISIKDSDLDFRGDYIIKKLEVAEGLDNIEVSINLIKNI